MAQDTLSRDDMKPATFSDTTIKELTKAAKRKPGVAKVIPTEVAQEIDNDWVMFNGKQIVIAERAPNVFVAYSL